MIEPYVDMLQVRQDNGRKRERWVRVLQSEVAEKRAEGWLLREEAEAYAGRTMSEKLEAIGDEWKE